MKKILPVFVSFLLLYIYVGFLPQKRSVNADIASCTANVSPNSVNSGTRTVLTFSITNEDDNDAEYIKISVPDDNFTITGYSISGWTGSNSGDEITFTGGILSGGSSMNAVIEVETGSGEAQPADFSVEMGDSSDGEGAINCNGSLDVEISGAGADVTAPVISSITVSDVTDSTVKVTWTTDESSNSYIEYGLTDDYGSETTDPTMTTSHSITLSSLTANSTYYYDLSSTDADGNTGYSGENTFVTASVGSSGSTQTGTVTTITTTTTVTRTITPTPTPTPTPDITPPKITVSTELEKFYIKPPKIEGKASDTSGVSAIEYSLDDGRNWQPVDSTWQKGDKAVTFSFTPDYLLDDTYKLKIRGSDMRGNTGTTTAVDLVIDRLPPLAGGIFMSAGLQELVPLENGIVAVLQGLDTKVTLSAVGGPISINLQYKLISEDSFTDSDFVAMVKNPDTGLWSGTFSIKTSGVYDLQSYSVDGAGNIKVRNLGNIIVLKNGQVINETGKVVKGARILVNYRDPVSRKFIPWDGESFGQKNPVITDNNGNYSVFLPAGTYYIEVTAPKYNVFVSDIFTLNQAGPVISKIPLKSANTFNIGRYEFTLPLSIFKPQKLDLSIPEFTPGAIFSSGQIGLPFPKFSFDLDGNRFDDLSLRGKSTILTMVSPWWPQISTQLEALEKVSQISETIQAVVVMPQTSVSGVSILKKRGRYRINILADPDGILVEPLNYLQNPQHIFVDRNGIIKKTRTGLLNEKELLDNVYK